MTKILEFTGNFEQFPTQLDKELNSLSGQTVTLNLNLPFQDWMQDALVSGKPIKFQAEFWGQNLESMGRVISYAMDSDGIVTELELLLS